MSTNDKNEFTLSKRSCILRNHSLHSHFLSCLGHCCGQSWSLWSLSLRGKTSVVTRLFLATTTEMKFKITKGRGHHHHHHTTTVLDGHYMHHNDKANAETPTKWYHQYN